MFKRNFDNRNQSRFSPINSLQSANVKTPEQIAFDIEFSKWEDGFKDWKASYANHPDQEAYWQYESKFLDVRDKLLAKRAQLYKVPSLQLDNQFDAASRMAESILSKFDDRGSGMSSGSSYNHDLRNNFSGGSDFRSSQFDNYGGRSDYPSMRGMNSSGPSDYPPMRGMNSSGPSRDFNRFEGPSKPFDRMNFNNNRNDYNVNRNDYNSNRNDYNTNRSQPWNNNQNRPTNFNNPGPSQQGQNKQPWQNQQNKSQNTVLDPSLIYPHNKW
jgi:hypothetical protein